jgi:hypothetical protein
MLAIKEILESHGHPVKVLHEIRVGYIVHEDDIQVIAEPFAHGFGSGESAATRRNCHDEFLNQRLWADYNA